MRIGVDFDNTIVCYDALFPRVARELGLAANAETKAGVREELQRARRENDWTELQGRVYGERMAEAEPFPGVIEFFKACREAGWEVAIVSHKTRQPVLGKPCDLHAAALRWLEERGFFDPAGAALPRSAVFFELTRADKLARITALGCTHFIDDLPEVFAEAAFPKIGRILFDPNRIYFDGPCPSESTWKGIFERLQFSNFAARHGYGGEPAIVPLAVGGNNRVYRVSDGARSAVLKQYFQSAADMRDRFGAERAFYEFLWSRGVRRTPEPLGWDAEQRLGLFAFVDGHKLRPEEVDAGHVDQAIQFIVEVNRDRANAESIPNASEACFSLAEHVAVIDKRLDRLRQIEAASEIDREAIVFARDALRPSWQRIRQTILASPEAPSVLRILSPSDFGFHNAILPADGRLRFFDFEYAGWDDPAKLICDFFYQPQVPAPLPLWDRVVSAWSDAFAGGQHLSARARLLLPAYQLKWVCIMLNEFLRHERDRRNFAKGAASAEQRKVTQLANARAAFAAIRC